MQCQMGIRCETKVFNELLSNILKCFTYSSLVIYGNLFKQLAHDHAKTKDI